MMRPAAELGGVCGGVCNVLNAAPPGDPMANRMVPGERGDRIIGFSSKIKV